jgi:hypothetical protein
VREDGIRYPVAQDNRYTVWDAFHNQYWPADYLVDRQGRIRDAHFGEGGYAATEREIRALLGEPAAAPARVRAQRAGAVSTPETYLGADRAQGWIQDPIRPGAQAFGTLPRDLPQDAFAYGGAWTISGHAARAGAGAAIAVRFGARRVFAVLGSPDRPRRVRELLDGRPYRTIAVRDQRLYPLVDLPGPGSHLLTLRVDPGVAGYAFTFG